MSAVTPPTGASVPARCPECDHVLAGPPHWPGECLVILRNNLAAERAKNVVLEDSLADVMKAAEARPEAWFEASLIYGPEQVAILSNSRGERSEAPVTTQAAPVSNPHVGSSLDSLFAELGELDEVRALTTTRILAATPVEQRWELRMVMRYGSRHEGWFLNEAAARVRAREHIDAVWGRAAHKGSGQISVGSEPGDERVIYYHIYEDDL